MSRLARADSRVFWELRYFHQESAAGYRAVIAFLGEYTLGSLLVSGFPADSRGYPAKSHGILHEPLEISLRRTGRFRRIQKSGYTPVSSTPAAMFDCDTTRSVRLSRSRAAAPATG